MPNRRAPEVSAKSIGSIADIMRERGVKARAVTFLVVTGGAMLEWSLGPGDGPRWVVVNHSDDPQLDLAWEAKRVPDSGRDADMAYHEHLFRVLCAKFERAIDAARGRLPA